ncbi:MAG: hypothetical protein WBA17_10005 [Saprospiraceae bacterium]
MKPLLFSLFLFTLLLCGCSPRYHYPSSPNVPLLVEKGEFKSGVEFGTGQLNLQASYAVTNHVAVMASGDYVSVTNNNARDRRWGRTLEAGVGYFRVIPENRGKFVMEHFAVAAIGNIENNFAERDGNLLFGRPAGGDLSGDFYRLGIQSGFGYREEGFVIGIALRAFGLNYRNVSGDLIYDNEDQVSELRQLGTSYIVEPIVTTELGNDVVRAKFQFGTSNNLSNNGLLKRNVFALLGITLTL